MIWNKSSRHTQHLTLDPEPKEHYHTLRIAGEYADIKREEREWQETKQKVTPCLFFSSPRWRLTLFITRPLWFNVGDYTCRWILCSHNVSIVQFADILNQIMSISVYKSLSMKTPSSSFLPSHSCPVFVGWQSILIHGAVTSLLSAVCQRRNKPSIQMN